MMVSCVKSNKLDGKERKLKRERAADLEQAGRFLNSRRRNVQSRNLIRCLSVIFLVVWDGVLLYMIARSLIVPVYGAAFVAVVSVYLGNKL